MLPQTRHFRSHSLIALLLLLPGCGEVFPVIKGNVLIVEPPDMPGNEAIPGEVLKIRWLGTSSYLIQLGDQAILTDPFYSYSSMCSVALGKIRTNPQIVAEKFKDIQVQDKAIFIGHSHFDHLMDAAEVLKQPDWSNTPIYGSPTTGNILAGYKAKKNWEPVQIEEDWQPVKGTKGVHYKAFRAGHAPHFHRKLGFIRVRITLYKGTVKTERDDPPGRATQFKEGGTFAYMFKFISRNPNKRKREYVVYVNSAAPTTSGAYDAKVSGKVDVAIMCVPGWKNVSNYPNDVIQGLKPRHILLSHYDDFFNPKAPRKRLVATADFYTFLRKAQEAVNYRPFSKILAPDVGAILRFPKTRMMNQEK